MRMCIVGCKNKIITANSQGIYVPFLEMFDFLGSGLGANYEATEGIAWSDSGTTLMIRLNDVDGANLQQVLKEQSSERNGLATHAYSAGYNGTTHVYPIGNNTQDAGHGSKVERLNRLMMYPFTYFFFYGGENVSNMRWVPNYTIPLQPTDRTGADNMPFDQMYFVRVTLTDLTTAGNNQPYFGEGDGNYSSKEFDINYSIYGIWNADGLEGGFSGNN